MSRIKRIALFFALALAPVLAHATACPGGTTCTQFSTGEAYSSTTIPGGTLTNTAGHSLVGILGFGTSVNLAVATPTITDGGGNVWQPAGACGGTIIVSGGYYYYLCLFYAPNIAAGSNAVTAHFGSSSVYGALTVLEYPWALTADNYDASNFTGALSSPAPQANLNLQTGGSRLLIGAAFSDYNNSGTFSVTSGFTQINIFNGGTYFQTGLWEQAGATAGAYVWNVSDSGTNRSLQSVLAAFRVMIPTTAPLQTNANSAGVGSTTVSTILPNTLTANSLLVAKFTSTTVLSTPSISGCGGSWSLAIATANGVDSIYYKPNSTGGASCTATVGALVAGFLNLTVTEYQGIPSSSPLDGTASNSASSFGGGATNIATSLTTTGATDLLYSDVDCSSGPNSSGPQTLVSNSLALTQRWSIYNFSNALNPLDFAFDALVSAGTQANTATVTGCNSGYIGVITAAFKTTGGAPTNGKPNVWFLSRAEIWRPLLGGV